MWNIFDVSRKKNCLLNSTTQTTLAKNLGNNLFKVKCQACAGRLACLLEEENVEAIVTGIASSGVCQHLTLFLEADIWQLSIFSKTCESVLLTIREHGQLLSYSFDLLTSTLKLKNLNQ